MNRLTFILLLTVFSFCIIQETEALVIKKRSKLPFSGKGTYYDVGPGSCGEADDDSEMVVAVNINQMNNGKKEQKETERKRDREKDYNRLSKLNRCKPKYESSLQQDG